MSAGTYLAISALRSAKMSCRERVSASGGDSSRERHFISRTSDVGLRTLTLTQTKIEYVALRHLIRRGPKSEVRRPPLHSRHLHPSQFAGETGFADLFEHFSHLGVLAKQVVDFLYAGARTASDALSAAAIHDFVM